MKTDRLEKYITIPLDNGTFTWLEEEADRETSGNRAEVVRKALRLYRNGGKPTPTTCPIVEEPAP